VKPLPIRLRLTVWYFALFSTAALLLSLTSWWMLRHTIEATLHQDLEERTDDVRMQLQQLGPQISLDQAQGRFDSIYRLRDDGKWLQILDQTGHWVYRSPRMIASNAPLREPQALPRTGLVAGFIQGTRSVRTLSLPITVNGAAYSIETGIALNKSLVLLHDFGLGLLFLTPAVVVIAAAAGHLMGRKALAPVALITHEARRITDRNLDSRLPVSPANDELSDLSITLNNMLTRIDAGFRSVRDFTANASHELRTPLARLRTEVEIALLRPRQAAEYRESLEHLHQATIDMSGLIDSLLTIARAEAGTEVLRMSLVDLSSLFRSITDEWSPIASRLSIRFQIAGLHPHDGPLTVLGDRLSILRLLRVLLDNAFKFTPSGGAVTITVTPGEDIILLAVDDTGIGIAHEHHKAVFDRFFRVHGDTGKHRTGAGLGLSLAQWIAEQHGTTISLTSTPEQGSRFQISLTRIVPDEFTAMPVSHDQVKSLEPVNAPAHL
jgi:signal transduction histidine kinase